ncbi:hypothetical protein AK812_SmicGene653 [Symbiodinium microadriaticum]|uniref:Uncharacterized protein n=1 Tax=Symbiodinium microadriaticum TaxID=2951 RepID=A0A1Q9F5R7_SYMMI|nr:hypothetical protein AK812_SmicGene653 [Symbiodinium microadriaticum]
MAHDEGLMTMPPTFWATCLAALFEDEVPTMTGDAIVKIVLRPRPLDFFGMPQSPLRIFTSHMHLPRLLSTVIFIANFSLPCKVGCGSGCISLAYKDPSLQFIMDIMMNAWADEVEADGDGLAPLPAPVPAGAGDGPAPLPAPVPGAGADDGAAPDTGVGADDPAGHAPADPAEGEATASFEAHDDAGDVYEPPEFESDDDHDDVCPLNRSLDDYFSEVAQDDDTCMAACDEASTNPAPEADAVPTPVEPVVPVPRPCEESNVGPQAPSLAPDSEAVPNPGELVVPMPTIPEHPSEPLPEAAVGIDPDTVDTQVYDADGAVATWEAGRSLASQSSGSCSRYNSFDSNAETLVLGAELDQEERLQEVAEVVQPMEPKGFADPAATEAAIGEAVGPAMSEPMADVPAAEMLEAVDHGMNEPGNVPAEPMVVHVTELPEPMDPGMTKPVEDHEAELPESVDPGTAELEVHEAEMDKDSPADTPFSVLDFKGQPDRKLQFEKPDEAGAPKKAGKKPKGSAKAVFKKPAARVVADKAPAHLASEAPVTPHRAQGAKEDKQDSAPKVSPKVRRIGKQPAPKPEKEEEAAEVPKVNTKPKAAKAKGKAKAKPKAAAGGKPANKRTSEDEVDEPKCSKKAKTEGAAGEREKAFARRWCPQGEGPSLQWRSLRDVYNSKLREHYRHGSKLEDTWWKFARPNFKGKLHRHHGQYLKVHEQIAGILQVSKAFISILLMLSWMTEIPAVLQRCNDVIELFAVVGGDIGTSCAFMLAEPSKPLLELFAAYPWDSWPEELFAEMNKNGGPIDLEDSDDNQSDDQDSVIGNGFVASSQDAQDPNLPPESPPQEDTAEATTTPPAAATLPKQAPTLQVPKADGRPQETQPTSPAKAPQQVPAEAPTPQVPKAGELTAKAPATPSMFDFGTVEESPQQVPTPATLPKQAPTPQVPKAALTPASPPAKATQQVKAPATLPKQAPTPEVPKTAGHPEVTQAPPPAQATQEGPPARTAPKQAPTPQVPKAALTLPPPPAKATQQVKPAATLPKQAPAPEVPKAAGHPEAQAPPPAEATQQAPPAPSAPKQAPAGGHPVTQALSPAKATQQAPGTQGGHPQASSPAKAAQQVAAAAGLSKQAPTPQEVFLKRFNITVTKERESLVDVPFIYLSKAEMAEDPYNMSETDIEAIVSKAEKDPNQFIRQAARASYSETQQFEGEENGLNMDMSVDLAVTDPVPTPGTSNALLQIHSTPLQRGEMSRAAEALADPDIKAEWERETAATLTLTKMRSVYSTMDANSDTLSALQTEGLMTGFYEIEGKVKVEMENARRVLIESWDVENRARTLLGKGSKAAKPKAAADATTKRRAIAPKSSAGSNKRQKK